MELSGQQRLALETRNPVAPAFTPMDTTPSSPPPVSVTASEDKTVAIVSYLTLIGFIVAVILHGNKKTALGSFHLRQMLGLIIVGAAAAILVRMLIFLPFVGWMLIPVVWLALLVLWLIGFIGAASGRMTPVPVLGERFQQWFRNAF